MLVLESYETKILNPTVSYWINIFFNVSFILESLLKIISKGLYDCPNSYLRDSWSCLDFGIVLSSIFDMLYKDFDYPFIRVLRIVRTLRPIRFLTHFKNLRLVMSSLIESITGIANVLVVIFLFWMIFGILGMSLLKGKMGYCFLGENENYYGINYEQCR